MNVFDPLYGRFTLPSGIDELAQAPEVRRLSQIRLLNTLTPSLAALGELRRYSHTLGVLRLALETPMPYFSHDERRAFLASVLLHDIGTPPFGHLLEYELRERLDGNWHHEAIIKKMLWGFHVPENRAHQIFGGQELKARSILRRASISMETVIEIIENRHALSRLLFGSLDLDNLDNVARMVWALGIGVEGEVAMRIASGLHVTRSGEVILDQGRYLADVMRWADLRRRAYEVIVFDPPTVAAQAVLTQALRIAIDEKILSLDDWGLYDETLLERLQREPETKVLISRDYLGKLPNLAFCIQMPGGLEELGLSNRTELEGLIMETLRDVFPRDRLYPYVFVDRGSFSKCLQFFDGRSGREWKFGTTSRSLVMYGFVRSVTSVPMQKQQRIAEAIQKRLGLSSAQASPFYPGAIQLDDERQIQLPI